MFIYKKNKDNEIKFCPICNLYYDEDGITSKDEQRGQIQFHSECRKHREGKTNKSRIK